MTEEVRKYAFIDALRGYAILAVLLVHSSLSVAPANSILRSLMNNGARGVQLFFIASALTLCLSWHFRSVHEAYPVRNFFIRRFFRIAPLFYAAVIFYVMLYGFSPRYWAPNGIKWWFVPSTVLFLHGYHPETITSVVPGGWSIAVEMNFYLLLPFLLRRLRTIRASAIVLIVSLSAYKLSTLAITHLLSGPYPAHQQYLVSSFAFLSFFGQLPVFAIGILTYFVFVNVSSLRRLVISANLLFLSLLVLLKLLTTFTIVRMLSHHIVMGAVFALFALTLGCFPVKLFVNRALALLGKISFGMYLTHFAVLELFKRLGLSTMFQNGDVPSILHYFCVVAVTAPLSYLLYITIERQGITYGKRLIDRLEQGAAQRRGWKGKVEGFVPVFGAPVSAALKRMS